MTTKPRFSLTVIGSIDDSINSDLFPKNNSINQRPNIVKEFVSDVFFLSFKKDV